MFNTNEYFYGKVKSVSFENTEGPASIGVMAPGEYKFGTSKKEYMTVTSGVMTVKLPGSDEWKDIQVGETFEVESNSSFLVKVEDQISYLCLYR